MFNAINEFPALKKLAQWAISWIKSEKSLGHRIIAFAIVEGIFFSGAFAAIFWLKKTRGSGKLFMEGLIKSNRFISRDEAQHVNFACALYSFIINRVSEEDVFEMIREANEISAELNSVSINCRFIGMNVEAMNQYINFISDRLLIMLGYQKLFNTTNPFDFMDTIGLLSKDNFFETRPTDYQQANNEENKDSRQFSIVEDF